MARLLRYGELPLVVLSCLSSGPRSAYQLMLDVEECFGGRYKPSTGALYPAVSGLEVAGLLAADAEASGTFVLTSAGWQLLAEKADTLAVIEARTGARVQPQDQVSRRLQDFASTVRGFVDAIGLPAVDAALNEAVRSLREAARDGTCHV